MRIDRVKFYLPLGRAVGFPLFPLEYFRLSLLISFFFYLFLSLFFLFWQFRTSPATLSNNQLPQRYSFQKRAHKSWHSFFSALLFFCLQLCRSFSMRNSSWRSQRSTNYVLELDSTHSNLTRDVIVTYPCRISALKRDRKMKRSIYTYTYIEIAGERKRKEQILSDERNTTRNPIFLCCPFIVSRPECIN